MAISSALIYVSISPEGLHSATALLGVRALAVEPKRSSELPLPRSTIRKPLSSRVRTLRGQPKCSEKRLALASCFPLCFGGSTWSAFQDRSDLLCCRPSPSPDVFHSGVAAHPLGDRRPATSLFLQPTVNPTRTLEHPSDSAAVSDAARLARRTSEQANRSIHSARAYRQAATVPERFST